MILVLGSSVSEIQKRELCLRLQKMGFYTRLVEQFGESVVSVDGPGEDRISSVVAGWIGVEKVVAKKSPFYLSSRECLKKNTIVKVGKGQSQVAFGSDEIVSIAGPCAIETEETAIELAKIIKKAGTRIFRGMIYKPRSSPYSFQGLSKAGIPILKKIKQETGLNILTEIRSPHEIESVLDVADMIQVGTRNMSNFELLKYLGQAKKPILLKRGMGATIEELLCAAEYLIVHGNTEIVLCERGIRTFEHFTRFTFDIGAVPSLKQISHLPVIVDPSHATGKSSLVGPLAFAALSAGADGLMIEIHNEPEKAFSDGTQSILPDEFNQIVNKGNELAKVFGRTLK